jgi:hypothetical protein
MNPGKNETFCSKKGEKVYIARLQPNILIFNYCNENLNISPGTYCYK